METVSHSGKVVSVDGDRATVKIISSPSCASCRAGALCTMSEAVEKNVEVRLPAGMETAPGDEVEVLLGSGDGLKAVLLAYIVPLALLLAFTLGAYALGAGELTAALSGLVAVALWYAVFAAVWRKRDHKPSFSIRKQLLNNISDD